MSDAWRNEAIDRINADFNRSADTHLVRVPLRKSPDIDLYLKLVSRPCVPSTRTIPCCTLCPTCRGLIGVNHI